MRFAHFFVDRPIFASVTVDRPPDRRRRRLREPAGRAVSGDRAADRSSVRATYPGANAETVAATVATPIEQEINGVENMLYMSSCSTNDGTMPLTVTFKLGTDLDMAQVLVQNRVAIAAAAPAARTCAASASPSRKTSPDLMMVVHLLSPDKTYDQLYLSNYAYLNVRDELLRLDGVGDVTIFGEREYSAAHLARSRTSSPPTA